MAVKNVQIVHFLSAVFKKRGRLLMTLDQLLDSINDYQRVVVLFYATNCGACRKLEPIIEKIIKDNKDNFVKLIKVNVDKHIDIAEYFDIMSVPSLKGFRDGIEVADVIGYLPENIIKTRLIDKIK